LDISIDMVAMAFWYLNSHAHPESHECFYVGAGDLNANCYGLAFIVLSGSSLLIVVLLILLYIGQRRHEKNIPTAQIHYEQAATDVVAHT
jgi:hypothetical protein